MERFGFSLQGSYALPMPQVIDLLADTGFSAVSPGFSMHTESVVRYARSRQLTVQSLHGPLRGMPALWSSDKEEAAPILGELLQAATCAAALEIPLLVVHPWNGVDYTFRKESLCFEQFDKLVAHAEALGIAVAFENLEGPEYLAALLERYAACKAVGFCWDSGHERCYAPDWDFLKLYGNRLLMTHLNDNFGVTDAAGRLQLTDDLHLLPRDGVIDWEHTVHRLKAAKPQEFLNFELKIRPKGDRCVHDLYSEIPLRTFLEEAFQRAKLTTLGYFE